MITLESSAITDPSARTTKGLISANSTSFSATNFDKLKITSTSGVPQRLLIESSDVILYAVPLSIPARGTSITILFSVLSISTPPSGEVYNRKASFTPIQKERNV